MEGQFYVLKDERQVQGFIQYLLKQLEVGAVQVKLEKVRKSRTDQQRKAIEVFCKLAAETLNENNLDKVAFFRTAKAGAKVPWTQQAVKEDIWKVVQDAVLKKKSTTQLTTAEVSQVYDVINARIFSERGLFVPFPEVDTHV